jgi:hypothetical protein
MGSFAMTDAPRPFDGSLNYFRELLATQARNAQALWQAQNKTLQSMGDLARHQGEMVEGAVRRALDKPPAVPMTVQDATAAMLDRIAWLKTTMAEYQANSGILSELATRDNGAVANDLKARMMAALDEFKAAVAHAVPESLAAAGADIPAAIADQIELFKAALNESQTNSNILAEAAARSPGGAVASALQARMTAALDEFEAALRRAIKPDKTS